MFTFLIFTFLLIYPNQASANKSANDNKIHPAMFSGSWYPAKKTTIDSIIEGF